VGCLDIKSIHLSLSSQSFLFSFYSHVPPYFCVTSFLTCSPILISVFLWCIPFSFMFRNFFWILSSFILKHVHTTYRNSVLLLFINSSSKASVFKFSLFLCLFLLFMTPKLSLLSYVSVYPSLSFYDIYKSMNYTDHRERNSSY
jgi:hypothetical protein